MVCQLQMLSLLYMRFTGSIYAFLKLGYFMMKNLNSKKKKEINIFHPIQECVMLIQSDLN